LQIAYAQDRFTVENGLSYGSFLQAADLNK